VRPIDRNRLGIAVAPPVPIRDVSPDDNSREWSARVIERFRRRLAVTEKSVARFVIGGDQNNVESRLSGIVEETILSLAHNHPIYVVGGFGGAAAELGVVLGLSRRRTGLTPDSMLARLTEGQRSALGTMSTHLRPPPFDALPILPEEQVSFLREHALGSPGWPHNGLSADENRHLFESTDPTDVTHLIVTGLMRRFAQSDFEAEV
jgi:hypothetical protein